MTAPLIISGPSGVGKTFLEKYLIQNYNFKRIQSTVTRPIRPGEINGIDYEFITEEEYKQFEKENAFVTSLYAAYAHRGLRKALVQNIVNEGKTPICVLVPQVMEQFTKAYPDTIAVFLMPENDDLLTHRMKLRGDTPQQIQERLDHALLEIETYRKLAHLYKASLTVTEDNFEETVNKILELTKQTK